MEKGELLQGIITLARQRAFHDEDEKRSFFHGLIRLFEKDGGGVDGCLGLDEEFDNAYRQTHTEQADWPEGADFHTIMARAVHRNVVVYDDSATAGVFSKRLLALLKTITRRECGGFGLKTVYCLPEDFLEGEGKFFQEPPINLTEEYLGFGGSFPSDKQFICLALGSRGEPLLGAY